MHKYTLAAAIVLILIIPLPLNSVRQKRIVGGKVSKDQRWKFAALIEGKNEEGRWSECTGAVISPSHILTAAHCVLDIKKMTEINAAIFIRKREFFARINILDKNEIVKMKSIKVAETYIHPNYNPGGATNDVAIVKVDDPQMAEIPPLRIARNFVYEPGSPVIEMGFGEHYGDEVYNPETDKLRDSEHLREVESFLHSIENCRKMWVFVVEDTHLCVGEPHKSITRGDSGGPLIVKGMDEQWYDVGVASFGGDNSHGSPLQSPVFMKITKYCKWIQKVTGNATKCHEMEASNDLTYQEMNVQNSAAAAITTISSSNISSMLIIYFLLLIYSLIKL